MKIIKKMMMITPLILSFTPMAPISSCSITNSIKPTSISRITEQDAKDTIVDQEEQRFVTSLKVENKNELIGVQIGTKTKIQMGITPEDVDKSLEFESSNPDVAVVEDGCVVAKGKGHTEITVHANISCPQHPISTFFYVNVYTEGCKVTFTSDENGSVTNSYVKAQVGSTFNDIIHNYDISCIPNEGYKFDDWYDTNGNVANFLIPITSDATIKATFKRLVFETDTWENVIKYADQGLDKLKKVYGIGSFKGYTRKVTINNKIHTVDVIGEEHDTCTETGKKAALTFQLTTLLSDADGNAITTQWDTGNNYNYTHGYLKGNLTGNGGKRSWDTTAYDMLPTVLRKGIKKVNKTVWEWNSDGEDGHYVDYSDYLFALTCTEYAQTNKDEEYHTEGTPYKYWADHNQGDPHVDLDWFYKLIYGDDNCVLTRILYDANGNDCAYWLASPHTQYHNYAWSVWTSGYIGRDYSIEHLNAVSFAFCI